MTLYENWTDLANVQRTPEDNDMFWANYFDLEKANYEKILSAPKKVYSGTVENLAKEFEMDLTVFMGFLDGINSSLKKELKLDKLNETTEIKLDIDYKKLYFNMLDAKADWLYNLSQWDDILSLDERREITKDWRISKQAVTSKKAGKNDPCPCGSGRKYKQCCMSDD